MSHDLVLAKKIYTLDKPEEFFTAMVIQDGRIKQLLHREQATIDRNVYDHVYDYSDLTVIPSFNDSHIHVLGYGKSLEYINFVGCTKEAFLEHIRTKVLTIEKDEWILGRGWDQEIFEQATYPTKFDLDLISPDHPMFFQRICGHISVVNSKTLQLANITKETPNPDGGVIDRDPLTGEPTGILREEATSLINALIPEPTNEQKLNWLRKALKNLNACGITSVQTNDGDIFDLYQKLLVDNQLTVRIYLTPIIAELEKLIEKGVKSNIGDDLLRWGRIKIFSDGSLGAETAALIDNYENSSNNGILIHQEKKLLDLITKAHNSGWQLETHAIGDRSAKLVVNLYEKTGSYKNRSVLTHCQILNQEIITKMSQLDIIANIQPIFLNTDLHWAEKKIGLKRMKFSYAWKTLLTSGILCAGGSDAPVEKPDPLLGIHAAVNRQDNEGFPAHGWYKEEALSIWDAINLFTVNSAYSEFQEHQKGKLLANYLADFLVLDKDIFLIPPNELRTIQIISTFMNGNQVFKQN